MKGDGEGLGEAEGLGEGLGVAVGVGVAETQPAQARYILGFLQSMFVNTQ